MVEIHTVIIDRRAFGSSIYIYIYIYSYIYLYIYIHFFNLLFLYLEVLFEAAKQTTGQGEKKEIVNREQS